MIYENVPGKILLKKPITRNGYKGFEVTNRTRRGDFQRYNISGSSKDLDRDRSNRFQYEENINAWYVNYNRPLKGMMVQAGLLVPTATESEFGIFKQVFADIGDDQSIESDLSTYSAHLSKMKHFTEFANGKTLVLIDEFGTGTDPQFGLSYQVLLIFFVIGF